MMLKIETLFGLPGIRLSDSLTTFPQEIFEFSESIEILDLSNNKLKSLPENFRLLRNLRILFLSNNLFEVFPAVISECPVLDIVGFKANRISDIPEDSLAENIRWLILTDNRIEKLPASIGKCRRLQKVMLAGNRLVDLPDEMVQCRNIELLRISANRFSKLPGWLLSLPKLTWLAFAGNNFNSQDDSVSLPTALWNELEVGPLLGQGASGIIYRATVKNLLDEVAMKVFKGEVTSDGLPADEMNAAIRAGDHPAIVSVLFEVINHPEGKRAVLFKMMPPTYSNLGLAPDFETCTRDTFPSIAAFSCESIFQIAFWMCSALRHLHDRGILHGDFYAHNILVGNNDHALLSDFGAATRYDKIDLELAVKYERLDVRAFGCLLEDLLARATDTSHFLYLHLTGLRNACLEVEPLDRPDFEKITSLIYQIAKGIDFEIGRGDCNYSDDDLL